MWASLLIPLITPRPPIITKGFCFGYLSAHGAMSPGDSFLLRGNIFNISLKTQKKSVQLEMESGCFVMCHKWNSLDERCYFNIHTRDPQHHSGEYGPWQSVYLDTEVYPCSN